MRSGCNLECGPATSVEHVSARAVTTANTSIPNDVDVSVALAFGSDDEERAAWDDGSFWTSSAPTRLSVGQPGRYQITGNWSLAASPTAGGFRRAVIVMNGGTAVAEDVREVPAATRYASSVNALYTLKAGDYLELRITQGSDMALGASGALGLVRVDG